MDSSERIQQIRAAGLLGLLVVGFRPGVRAVGGAIAAPGSGLGWGFSRRRRHRLPEKAREILAMRDLGERSSPDRAAKGGVVLRR